MFYMILTKSLLPKSETSELTSLNKGIAEQRWQNAKTYEKTAPHEYFIKSWNPQLFSLFLKAIKLNGKDEIFSLFGHEKMYCYIYDYSSHPDSNLLTQKARGHHYH